MDAQVVINMQAGKILEIDKCAGGNKAAQVGISKIDSKKIIKKGKFSKINKHVRGNKAVQVGYFQKIDKLRSTFIRYF